MQKIPTLLLNNLRATFMAEIAISLELCSTFAAETSSTFCGITACRMHLGKKEEGFLEREYEILLQKGARFDIIEAQKFNDRTIIVVRWVPNGK